MTSTDTARPTPTTSRVPRLHLVSSATRAVSVEPRTFHRGVPRTADEWTALVRVASGEMDVPAAHTERLRALGLVVTVSGRAALTRHGRYTLGLAA